MANACLANLVLILAALSAISLSSAEDEQDTRARRPYIIHIVKSAKPSHFTSHQHWYASMLDQLSQSDPNGRELLYTYNTVLHGFAAMLSSAEVEAMESMDGCLAVIPSSVHQLDTTHSPEFLGLSGPSGVWSNFSTYGQDIIVGVIDTGIWPESKSFSDAGLGPVPSRWNGSCQVGQNDFNTTINPTSEYASPRDSNTHGTHVASILAGAEVNVSSSYANGTASGMAPQARLAIYKVCWAKGCSTTDIAAAMDEAVADGVDIISISIGSSDVPFYQSSRAIATFGVIEKGFPVFASMGNREPNSSSLSNPIPWVTTVGFIGINRGRSSQCYVIRMDNVINDNVDNFSTMW
ncbi:subtilisin-like protease SBT1.5 [Cryptomeria japonica]|uniref:subtilisin-like protease SBT1.5 n=1 Tax=Cryptomeria japonica TaxID=3369 RepID=UPI0025AD0D2E|nr:subtilisin-like protease SBT1.5 [Cryptomeria japonica]